MERLDYFFAVFLSFIGLLVVASAFQGETASYNTHIMSPAETKQMAEILHDPTLRLQWIEFRQLFDRYFPKLLARSPGAANAHKRDLDSDTSRARRMKIFRDNMAKLDIIKKKNPHAEFGVSVWSHLTDGELEARFMPDKSRQRLRGRRSKPAALVKALLPRLSGGKPVETSKDISFATKKADIASKVKVSEEKHLPTSYRLPSKYLSPIKDQGNCACCWAFAATQLIETAIAIQRDSHAPVLSTQNLLDCTPGSGGCDAGIPTNEGLVHAFKTGLLLESHYPQADRTIRRQDCQKNVLQRHKSELFVPKGYFATADGYTESQLARLMYAAGAVAARITPDFRLMAHYRDGVISEQVSKPKGPYHAVQLVGWVAKNGDIPEAWIFRNSWGTLSKYGSTVRLTNWMNRGPSHRFLIVRY